MVNQRPEAIAYFSQPAFKKVLKELQRKFYHHGNFGKSIGYQNFSEAELQQIMSFMGISDWEWQQKNRLSVVKFLESYQNSRFGQMPIEDLIVEVTKQKLVDKQSVRQQQALQRVAFYQSLEQAHSLFMCYLNEATLNSWFKRYLRQPLEMEEQIEAVAKALDHLPQRYEKLPFYAYQLFQNPHALDRQTLLGQLFYDMLAMFAPFLLDTDRKYQGEAERENDLYGCFFLLKDDAANAVQISQLVALKKQAPVDMWTAACQDQISWNVPLKHILEVDAIQPYCANKVLVVENSGVFSVLVEQFPRLAIVCSSGQFKYSVWKILEKLSAGTATIYYTSDLDPAGMQMAQKVLYRFGGHVKVMFMDAMAYAEASGGVSLSSEQMRQVASIHHPQLLELKACLLNTQESRFQEGLLKSYIRFLSTWEES